MLHFVKALTDYNKKQLTTLALLVCAALFMRLAFAWISLTELQVTGDEASLALLAKMIHNGLRPLLFIGQPYQFPFESYLMAPFIEWLPRNALGVRYQSLLLGIISLFGFLFIAFKALPPKGWWPAILLILFPSAYLIIITAAYAPPQYSIGLTFAWLSIALALSASDPKKSWPLLFCGLFCGLGLSNHLLTISITAGVVMLVIFAGNRSRSLQTIWLFACGFTLGILPYLLARYLIPGAYLKLKTFLPPEVALERLYATITVGLSGAMGVNPILFPDFKDYLGWPDELRLVFAAFYLALIVYLLYQRISVFGRQLLARQWPRLELVDLALICSLATLWLFASHYLSAKAHRYFLPAVWCFPFLVGYLFSITRGRWQRLVGAWVIILVFFNLGATMHTIYLWRLPGKVEAIADTPKIEGLIDYLRTENISHCYASFWLSYRITLATDEEIICSMPYNSRFFHWPIPYKEEVDRARQASYVLTQSYASKLRVIPFEKEMWQNGIRYQRTSYEPFHIYHHFTPIFSLARHLIRLDEDQFLLRTENGSEQLDFLTDDDTTTIWRSNEKQAVGQWLEVGLARRQKVAALTIFHLPQLQDSPKEIQLEGYDQLRPELGWFPLTGQVRPVSERFRFYNSRPNYKLDCQQIHFMAKDISSLRIKITKANPETHWAMTGLEVQAESPERLLPKNSLQDSSQSSL